MITSHDTSRDELHLNFSLPQFRNESDVGVVTDQETTILVSIWQLDRNPS